MSAHGYGYVFNRYAEVIISYSNIETAIFYGLASTGSCLKKKNKKQKTNQNKTKSKTIRQNKDLRNTNNDDDKNGLTL